MAEKGYSSLQLRVISACILAPIAIAALYLGGLYFMLLLALAAIAMSYEWCHVSLFKNNRGFTVITGITVLVALAFSYDAQLYQSLIVLICGGLAMALIGSFLKQSRDVTWLALGPFYIGIPVVAVQALREMPETGFAMTLALFFVIWATDIGAYFAGKTIGGPKIAPTISPNKTWAGLIGGMIAASLTAYCMVYFLINENAGPFGILLLGAAGAVLAQVGDFTESAWKRKFGVKDASNLIPGHGGVFDRLDGVLFVAPVLLALLLLAHGN